MIGACLAFKIIKIFPNGKQRPAAGGAGREIIGHIICPICNFLRAIGQFLPVFHAYLVTDSLQDGGILLEIGLAGFNQISCHQWQGSGQKKKQQSRDKFFHIHFPSI